MEKLLKTSDRDRGLLDIVDMVMEDLLKYLSNRGIFVHDRPIKDLWKSEKGLPPHEGGQNVSGY